MGNVTILIIIIVLMIDAIGATLMKNVAAMKGYEEGGTVWCICFLLGIGGYLYVIALPDKTLQKQNQQIINLINCFYGDWTSKG